ncbi:pyrroloquinoline quinone biosynthesis peptide chaperone PqqD [Granulosicoccus antarcticus]|uniref:PqqA binding protein n=1 Tax=Granulosicoccus antarcticus IMCC3135 TaxID=1192854 RepID=A0A2Z2NTN3_9GAMM|nr:pyrroloquinoline quinone biosynthesis peptide chaperone PqqD [Granulosicoccus antarcticus]ASJ74912.1 Coenzyme PQQ synthesis protein D [Granulosicoccus antarcticus IMCC3135]
MTEINSEHVPAISNGYRLQFEEAQDTWVLLYPEGMVKLNPTASHILQRCDGKSCVQDIIDQLEAAFETTGLNDDVQGFLTIASEQHWITLS